MESRLDKKYRQRFEGSLLVKYLGVKRDKDEYLERFPHKTERDFSWHHLVPTILLEVFLWFVLGVTIYFLAVTHGGVGVAEWTTNDVAPSQYFDSADYSDLKN